MKTYEFKNILFNYINEKFSMEYPLLKGKIYRERLRINQPKYPYLVLKSGERTRINKRFENYLEGNSEFTRVQYRLPITFTLYDLKSNPEDAEQFCDEVIDYIESFFADNLSTHIDLRNLGIVVNELMISGVRDMSTYAKTDQEFVREIDIVFEFEELKEFVPERGQDLSVDITSLD